MKRSLLLILSFFFLNCMPAAPCVPVRIETKPPRWYVILDYGHGGRDCGAIGADTGVKESDLNLTVGEKVAAALEERDCRVLRTRTDRDALADTKRSDMALRGAILCTEGADCTVSIHMNKFADRSVKGPMCFYQAGAEEGRRLAQCVTDALCAALERPARPANPGNNYVTRIPDAPSVLVECGFLSNPEEERDLQDPAYQQRIADAVADGVIAYLESRGEAETP